MGPAALHWSLRSEAISVARTQTYGRGSKQNGRPRAVVKSTKNPEQPTTPSEFAQVPPRDLYPTSDIRFVLVEIGKLSASVDRLIDDVSAQGTKVDAIRHQVSF